MLQSPPEIELAVAVGPLAPIVRFEDGHLLDAAYDDIETRQWWLAPGAGEIDHGDFYAQMKAPTRVRDLASGELRYRWTEVAALDHYRHAQAFDHLAGFFRDVPNVVIL